MNGERKQTLRRVLRRPLEWFGILLGVAILSSLPRRGLFAVCDFVAWVMYLCDGRGKRIARTNLGIMYADHPGGLSEKRRELLIRRSYRNQARSIGHAFWTCRNARERAAASGEVCRQAHDFLAVNRPAITVSGHIGCWEILSQLGFLEGHAMMSVAKDIGSRGMTKLLMKARKSIGQEIVPAEGALKPLLSGLRAGKSLGLLVDQVVQPEDGGIWIRFFGRAISVSAAPALFSGRTKTPVVIAWSRPLKDLRYRCEMVASYAPDEARDIWKLTQRIAKDLEGIVRRHPSCWILSYHYFGYIVPPEALAKLEERERTA